MKNLKNEVINLKDEIKEMMSAKDGELGKQAEGRMKNAAIPENNRNKSRENETDSSEIKSESINDVLGADMIDKKFNSNIGLESQIKAIQIKEICEANQSKQNQSRNNIRKEAEIKESGWDRKSEWNTVSPTYKRTDIEADRKAWHKYAIASERDTEKHWRIISLLVAIQIKQSDYMRQYVWNSELSAKEIAFWKQLLILQYQTVACYL